VAAATLGWLPAGPARAVDDPVEFLRALQNNGYPDVAVDYLNALKKDPGAPKEILGVWDWEMSKSLKAAAKWAYSETDAKKDMEQAETHLKKFIDENPKRPEAIRAAAEWAATAAEEALRNYRRAKELPAGDQKAEAMDKVRESLEEVRTRFAQAEEVSRQMLRKATPRDRNQAKLERAKPERAKLERAKLEDDVLDGHLKVAMIDFYIGLTYTKKSQERADHMDKAAKVFDELYQSHRETGRAIWSLSAHYFTGRCLQEEGKLSEAQEIYEEVLSADSHSGTPETPTKGSRKKAPTVNPLDDLLAEAEQHYLECLAAQDLKAYFKEADEWRSQHRDLEKRDGYQAVSFDLVKICRRVAENEKTSPAQKKRVESLALRVLAEMVKVPSQYQAEAIKLRRQLLGGEDPTEGFEGLIVDADELARDKKWTEARKKYEEALEMGLKSKDVRNERLAGVRNAIAGCDYNIAMELFRKGKLDEAVTILRDKILRDEQSKSTPTATAAAALLLNVLLNQYNGMEAKTDDDKAARAAAEKQLVDTAEKIIKGWPGKSEADAARLTLERLKIGEANQVLESRPDPQASGPQAADPARALAEQAALFQGKVEEATKIWLAINPRSEHLVTGCYLIGYTYWRGYRVEKRQIEGGIKVDDETKQRVDAWCQRGIKAMQKAVDTLTASPPTEGRVANMLRDSTLLLAEMQLDQGNAKGALPLFQRLVDELAKSGAQGLDPVAMQTCNGAIQAYMQIDNLEKAGSVCQLLVKLGSDSPNVNLSLVTFARRLEADRKRAQDAVEAAKGAAEAEDAKKKRDSCDQLLRDLLGTLAGREKLTPASMVWIAQTCAAMGMADEAEKVAREFLNRMENDSSFNSPESVKMIPRVRTLLISILRQQGKFDEAKGQVETLIAEHPKALEPQMERCLILQSWAEKNAEKYSDAVRAWEGLRRKLEKSGTPRVRQGEKPAAKPVEKPRELYDVTYNEAQCLYSWVKKKGDKKNATDGLALLKQMLMLDPQLNGPDTVTRYVKLCNEFERLLNLELTKRPEAPKKPVTPSK
jgi:tetratricopeptide (TPR) repeat protein